MPTIVNIHDAKTNLSRLLVRVANGEEVIISRADKPIAKIVPIAGKPRKRMPGSAKGKVVIKRRFDAPLPRHIMKAFEK